MTLDRIYASSGTGDRTKYDTDMTVPMVLLFERSTADLMTVVYPVRWCCSSAGGRCLWRLPCGRRRRSLIYECGRLEVSAIIAIASGRSAGKYGFFENRGWIVANLVRKSVRSGAGNEDGRPWKRRRRRRAAAEERLEKVLQSTIYLLADETDCYVSLRTLLTAAAGGGF